MPKLLIPKTVVFLSQQLFHYLSLHKSYIFAFSNLVPFESPQKLVEFSPPRKTHPLGPKSCRVVKQLTVMVIIANDPLNKAGLNKDRSN